MRGSKSWFAGCWVPKQPRKKVCLLWNAVKLHGGGGGERPPSCPLENSDSSRDKSEGQTTQKTKNVTLRKIQPTSAAEHCQEASCLPSTVICSVPYHLPWWMKLPTLICKLSLQKSSFPSFLVWSPHWEDTLLSPTRRRGPE